MKNNHHLLFDRQEWTLRPESRLLREDPSLIVPMEMQDHNELHRYCPSVPLLGYHALMITRRDYKPESTPLQSVEELMSIIERSSRHPRAHELQKRMAELTVWGLDLQRPFIAGLEYDNG